ncbi:MAG: SagB/ThcOx family dehydrogenase [Pseudomonadota bacterium]
MKILTSALGLLMFLPALGLVQSRKEIILPTPSYTGKKSLEEVIKSRRTVRDFQSRPLGMQQLSQLLWAAYGVTSSSGPYKSVPSAGALYPLDIWVVAGDKGVEGLDPGVYHYGPKEHSLVPVRTGDVRNLIARASLGQTWMAKAPVTFVITGEYERCTRKYGERGVRYTHIEAGHSGQNLFLQAEALGLGAGIVGAFYGNTIQEILGIEKIHDPILVMPAGYRM